MTPQKFRTIALGLPEALEQSHMGHPDFRVGGKIFATLGYPDKGWGVVKLTPKQQQSFVEAQPEIFQPVKGGWGRQGHTNVRLSTATQAAARLALITAWRNTAPKQLLQDLKDE